MKTNLDKLRKKFSRKGMYYVPLDVFNEKCEAIRKYVDDKKKDFEEQRLALRKLGKDIHSQAELGGIVYGIEIIKQLLEGEGE